MVTGNLYKNDLTTGATTSVGATSAAVLPAGCTVRGKPDRIGKHALLHDWLQRGELQYSYG